VPASDGRPDGEVYDWYVRGARLLDSGDAAAAAILLRHAYLEEPDSRSIRESLGRALLGSSDFDGALKIFQALVADDPADDFARFASGKAAMALGNVRLAMEQFALATAMRPANSSYAAALRGARQAHGAA
jgi:Flp pilus assembly protein TadD